MTEKRTKQSRFTITEEKEICDLYNSGIGCSTIAKEKKCSPATINTILKYYGVKIRTYTEARRIFINYQIDENIFETIDNQDKAYWLGVMYSDGYISTVNGKYNFGISVSEKDFKWLEKFKIFLKYNGNISHYYTSSGYKIKTQYCRLLIGNKKIVEDLKKLGVVEKKTKKIKKIPDIPYKLDFIRGYIDGDGSLLKRLPNFQISGNYDFLISIANFLKLPYHIYKDKSIYSLRYNKKESEYLEKILYKDANYYLERKYQIATRSFNSPLTLEDVMEKSE